MKNFLVFLITLFFAIFYFSQQDLFSKTRSGEKNGKFILVTEPSDALPHILREYLKNHNVRYEYYKIPNYVRDFLSKNIDYGITYKFPNRYTAILFIPEKSTDKNYISFEPFYNELLEEKKIYGDEFQVIYKHDLSDKIVYQDPYDAKAFEDLKMHCHSFCLINPSNDTILSFKYITNTEIDAIEVMLQQYDMIR